MILIYKAPTREGSPEDNHVGCIYSSFTLAHRTHQFISRKIMMMNPATIRRHPGSMTFLGGGGFGLPLSAPALSLGGIGFLGPVLFSLKLIKISPLSFPTRTREDEESLAFMVTFNHDHQAPIRPLQIPEETGLWVALGNKLDSAVDVNHFNFHPLSAPSGRLGNTTFSPVVAHSPKISCCYHVLAVASSSGNPIAM